jgi:hypothetical protein
MDTPSQDSSNAYSTDDRPGHGDGSIRRLFTNVDAGIERAWFDSISMKGQDLVKRIIPIVHKGARKLRMKAYPFGHPLTRKVTVKWILRCDFIETHDW